MASSAVYRFVETALGHTSQWVAPAAETGRPRRSPAADGGLTWLFDPSAAMKWCDGGFWMHFEGGQQGLLKGWTTKRTQQR